MKKINSLLLYADLRHPKTKVSTVLHDFLRQVKYELLSYGIEVKTVFDFNALDSEVFREEIKKLDAIALLPELNSIGEIDEEDFTIAVECNKDVLPLNQLVESDWDFTSELQQFLEPRPITYHNFNKQERFGRER